MRDTQRSKVYAWERAVAKMERRDFYAPQWNDLNDVRAWLEPVWRTERGRYGLARQSPPPVVRPHRGQRQAMAHYDGRISLPRWARSPWIALHELAHQLAFRDHHGSRFVGVLIGLVCRHLEYEPTELMQMADEHGVKYNVRSIGSVPVRNVQWRALKALKIEGPMSPMDLACWLSIGTYHEALSERQVRGAMLSVVGKGRARLLRGKYHLLANQPVSGLAADAVQAAAA